MQNLFNYLISPANAQASGGGLGGFDLMSLLPLVLIFVVFYIFLIRPQQKKAQQQKALLDSLRRGDRVLTSGGLIGIITKVIDQQELQIEIAEGVRVRIARAMIADRISVTEPVAETQSEQPAKASKKAPIKKASRTKKVASKK